MTVCAMEVIKLHDDPMTQEEHDAWERYQIRERDTFMIVVIVLAIVVVLGVKYFGKYLGL